MQLDAVGERKTPMLSNERLLIFTRIHSCSLVVAVVSSRVSSEGFVHTFHRHASLADCGGAAFHRTRAHVAGREHARLAGLQRPRRTAHVFPSSRDGYGVPGFDEPFCIALDLG